MKQKNPGISSSSPIYFNQSNRTHFAGTFFPLLTIPRSDSGFVNPKMTTPVKNPHAPRSQTSEICRISENFDPNVPNPSPSGKPMKSPALKSAKSKKSAPKIPNRVLSSPPPVPERKFIVAKKNSKRQEKNLDVKKRSETAYEALRSSQEQFFKKDQGFGIIEDVDKSVGQSEISKDGEEKGNGGTANTEPSEGIEYLAVKDLGIQDLEGSLKERKMRNMMMEEEINGVPEPGSGRVKHLVKAFESLLSISKEKEDEIVEESKQKVMNWALPGLQEPPKAVDNEVSSSPSFSSVEFFPSREFERDCRVSSSMDSKDGRSSSGSRTSDGGRRSRRNSSDSSGRSWNKKLKVTSQQPFKLRTEQRGRLKEEHFLKKVTEMLMEEEKQRIPVAQGLPWTTDQPENLVKPPIKETTEPIDLVLHSDVRAVERTEFDRYVAERMTFAEQTKMEREMQRKLEEEDEIRRLRRELVPRAQPMPYFDRPFVPKRSTRARTVPKEPRFHPRSMKA